MSTRQILKPRLPDSGMENMSMIPYAVPAARWGARMGNTEMVDLVVFDGLHDIFFGYRMGVTAENIADVAEELLQQAETELKELGGEVAAVVCNVTVEDDCTRLAETAIETFGQINLVAPFAGIIKDGLMLSPDRETGKVTKKMLLKDFQVVIDINLTGVFLTVRECTEQMINHNCKGLISLISSTGSLGTAGQINYSSTKAAMSVMPKVITAEFFRRGLADKIRCVAVAPGYVGTDMVKGMNQKALEYIVGQVPIGRLIEPEEVATLVGDIYRNEAITGEVFFINGGLRLGSKG